MHFQIYVPAGADLASALEAVGLAHLATGFDARPIEGPDGGNGALFSWLLPTSKESGYRPDAQSWQPAAQLGDDVHSAGRYWIGFWHDSPPRETQLARPYQQSGRRLKLGDGGEWLIPLAAELPSDVQLADDGSLKFELQCRFHRFGIEVEKWLECLASIDADDPAGNQVEYDALWKFAIQALEINYRIAPEVASYLRLFDTNSLAGPMLTVVGCAAASAKQSGATL